MPLNDKKTWYPLIMAVVLIGAHATIAQVLLVRELLVVFYGNELCLGVIFGAWLLGVAIGAGIGGKVIKNVESRFTVFLFLLLALCLLLPMQVSIIRLLRYLIDVPYGQHISILSLLWSSPLIIMPFSFVIGFVFPFSVAVFQGFTRGGATDIGVVYILESIGSLMGGTVFTFVLAPWSSSYETMAALTSVVLINMIALILFVKVFPRKVLLGASISPLIISLWFIFSGDIGRIESFFVEKRWQSFNPSIRLMESADSKYQNIVIGKEQDQYSVYSNGQYTFAFPNVYEYGPVAHLILSEHPSPKRVLLIGGGVGGLLREMLKYPLEEVHYIEIDPKLLEITEKYLPEEDRAALADQRVKVFPVDGRYFVKTAQGKYKYDVIFINVPDPSTAALNRFYTLEFFQEAKGLLEHDGILVTSISSAVVYIGEVVGSYTGSIYRTLKETFPYVIVTPGQTNYYFACLEPNIITADLDTLIARYKERNIRT
ncbi:MAG TPA: spermidine synthase, partial [Candidatus Avalokitesvara rifleensis]|uniref:spermidine synthase n=1 Tax=Candidatus Avalokitesvara rifleensis TaxID=3367620 RepID=UPI0040293BEC